MAANNNQLQEILRKPYDRFLFSKNVLSTVFGSALTLNNTLISAPISPNKSESTVIDKVGIYGSIQLEDGTEVTCYEILLQSTVRIEQSKVAIQQYVRKLLTAGQAALINFVSLENTNVWRLTLVAKDSILTDKGVTEKTTNPKRYTFLLGPSETCRTAAERFQMLSIEKDKTLQALINAFSVEKLSKAFFDEYTLHYQNFCNYLQESNYRKSVFDISFSPDATKEEKDNASKPIRDFVKKLLGRIVFLYFVQKKGWLGASDTTYTDGQSDFIMQLFEKSGKNDNFYNLWLTKLFFDTLNKERPNDDFIMPDDKTVKVPFLNGGLFDKENFDEHILTFKPELFHHPDFAEIELTAKSKGETRGFLDFLDAFNFTIYEDSPDEHTVAVDPEMLGHIFESLLEDNKDKGAFYTPKEIVHYMCQESLIAYCLNLDFSDCGITMKDEDKKHIISELIKNKEIDSDRIKKSCLSCESWYKQLEGALDTVKICDPAIGSGAFPMGLLQEIFSIKELIAYETDKEWRPAETKLNIIQNSIYGVDIEKGAVDIARLRFWLSLVVDEEKPKPLPNLDYKIVVGNSLISKFNGEIIEIDWEIKSETQTDIFGNENLQNRKQLLQKLTDKQQKYFDPTNKNKKPLALEIRNHKIDILVNQLELMIKTEGLDQAPISTNFNNNKKFVAAHELYIKTKGWKKNIDVLLKLKKQPDKPFKHFDWKLDFPEVLNPYLVNDNAGFDIVIGNPPYIQLQKNAGLLAEQFENQNVKTFARTGDIYSLFYEKGVELLKHKGHLCYITSNKWMRAGYGEKTRKFFAENTNPILLIDFAGQKIFESATVDTNILLLSKEKNFFETKACVVKDKVINNLSLYLKQHSSLMEYKNSESWVILSPIEQQIKKKIEAVGTPLKEWDIQINYGIKTGFNEAFIIDGTKRKELIKQDPKSAEIIRPILRGRDIKRYGYNFADKWLINTHNGIKEKNIKSININDYPAIKRHLDQFYPQLEKRVDKGDTPYNLRNCAYMEDFYKQKITYIEIMTDNPSYDYDFPCFTFDTESCVVLNTAYIMSGNPNELKHILGILNSNLGRLLVKNYVVQLQQRQFRMLNQYVINFPIPRPEKSNVIKKLVDEVLKLKEQNKNTFTIEQKINDVVYEIFNFNDEEIKFIKAQ